MGTNYYVIANYCPYCNRGDEIHIGKQSAGWKFCFQAHDRDDLKLKTSKDWFEYIEKNHLVIHDEYGQEYDLESFKNHVKFKEGMSSSVYNGDRYSGPRQVWERLSKTEYIDPEGYDFCSEEFS